MALEDVDKKSKNRTSKWKNLLKSRKYEKQKCRIDEKFSEALLQLLVLFQSFRINHRLKRYTKILQGLYWRTAIEYSYAAEPPVQFRLSHLSRRSEPL